jgi:hypothetical protein
MVLTADQVLTAILILVAVMLVIVLYHALFIVVDLRKVMKRVESVSGQVEDIIMKPLTMTDTILQWVLEYIESLDRSGKKKHEHKKVVDAE